MADYEALLADVDGLRADSRHKADVIAALQAQVDAADAELAARRCARPSVLARVLRGFVARDRAQMEARVQCNVGTRTAAKR